jgi:hypothetical protein
MSNSESVDDTGPGRLWRPVKYVAHNEAGSILATKTYARATWQNSIDFISYVLGRTANPIRVIRTDWSLVFQEAFTRHLAIHNLKHERIESDRA